METVDEEITSAALGWMERQAKGDKPFFLWYNSTAMHFRTHVAAKNLGKSGQDPYSDRMVVHDEQIGMILDKLDELGISDNTIVMYSTDNGPENDTWPDGANSPFRAQKDTNYEGAWRVPAFLRWPGKIKAGSVLNGIVSHQDMLPTLLAAAGVPDINQKLLDGYKAGDKTFNVCIDGINQLPYLTGQAKESPRNHFFYVSDDGGIMAIRIGDYKLTFEQQRATTMRLWAEPFVKLRVPYICNLRRDPFERADFNSNTYFDWMVDHVPQLYLAQAITAAQIENFVKYPPRQKAASFNLDAIMASLGPAQAAYKAKEAAEAKSASSKPAKSLTSSEDDSSKTGSGRNGEYKKGRSFRSPLLTRSVYTLPQQTMIGWGIVRAGYCNAPTIGAPFAIVDCRRGPGLLRAVSLSSPGRQP